MATAVEKAIDITADVAEDVAEESAQVAEATRALTSRDVGLVFGGVGVGVAIGAVGGYFLLKKQFTIKYEHILNEEVAGMRSYYDSKHKALDNEREKLQLEKVESEIKDRQEDNGGDGTTPYHQMYKGGSDPDKPADLMPEPEAPTEDAAPVVNIFNKNGEDPEVEIREVWDYDEELKSRSPQVPFVIHRDEYNDETPEGFDQYTLTYFEGDDVLCKDDDSILEDKDATVGLGNLSKFGHGSGDPTIVYIRNHELRVDLEVVHSDGKYATEVAGFPEDELQHSSMRRRLPRRSDIDSER